MIKKGFSLAEILVCLMAMGVLMVLTISTIKPTEKIMRMSYSNAYEGLSNAFYNLMLERTNDDNDPFATSKLTKGPEILCKGLINQINYIESNCSNKAANLTSDIADAFPDSKVQFVSNSGYRFFISNWKSYRHELPNDDATYTKYYFLVFVDINGRKGPNRLGESETDKTPSDIFAFALLDSGMTVPLGIPEYDMRYLQARLAYYDKHSKIVYAEPSMPYYLAKNAAWGCYDGVEDKNLSADAKSAKEVFENPEIPFTMNEKIRGSLNSNSKIHITLPEITNELKKPKNNEDSVPNCSYYDYDNCFVVIDKFSY